MVSGGALRCARAPRSAPRRLTVLGATGSVGRSTLDVITRRGGAEAYEIVALTGASNIELLAEQARALRPHIAVTADEGRYGELRDRLAGSGIEVAAGLRAIRDVAAEPTDWCMAAIAGFAGLEPTLEIARQGAVLALANKEALVCAGDLLLGEIMRGGGALLPVDSEHNAIFQVLEEGAGDAVERIIVTASGGPFRDWSFERMRDATLAEALTHPNWSMGEKITIASASMFNKALEVIEARHLFDVAPEKIEVLVHPQSVIHSMVGYADGSILAQLGPADMRAPIAYALGWPERASAPVERLDFAKIARLDFEAPDEIRFPALRLAREALNAGGLIPCVLNGAHEAALEAFMAGRIGFTNIAEVVEKTMAALSGIGTTSNLPEVFKANILARRAAAKFAAASDG